MTREEEIKYASKDYVNYLLDKQEYHNENYTEDDILQAFEKGAKWTDENTKSPWISIKDDLPCNHEEFTRKSRMSTKLVFVRTRKATYFVNYMIKEKSKWKWFCAVDDIEDEIEYWMPIPNLPQE